MGTIYTIGEVVYDIVFKDNQPQRANAGGAMLNTAMSLGLVGKPVQFVGETGDDTTASIISSVMEQNGVGTLHIQRYSGRNTTVALAFLDSNNNASYVFHKDYPQQRLPHPLPVPRQGDFVLFGSSFAITPSVRPALVHFLKSARHNGATVIYDPNFRKPRLSMDEVLPMIEENISFANIVRGSDEDFHNIFATSDLMDIYKEVSRCGCQVLVVTRGSKGASLVTERVSITVDSQNITPLSTIGAGDNFNAGLLYGLHELASTNTSIVNLSESQWKTLLDTGTRFACNVCLSLDNHVSRDFASSFKKH